MSGHPQSRLSLLGVPNDQICGPHLAQPGAAVEVQSAGYARMPPHVDYVPRSTSDMDVPALAPASVSPLQLEAALAAYPSTLLLVTHDRGMLEAVTVNRRIELADGTVTSR